MQSSPLTEDVIVVGDIGSTFTKLAALTGDGQLKGRIKRPTTHNDLAEGVIRGHASLASLVGVTSRPDGPVLCSSAGGGLRVVVLGFERELTVKAALRTSMTAGARVVATFTNAELDRQQGPSFDATTPDLALLTGGTDGGDEESIVRAAESLRRFAPELPVVVAGNVAAHARVRRALGNGRPTRFVPNVMPRVGEVDGEAAQTAIRELFLEHVIGRGCFSAGSEIAAAVKMPTPAAVLAGAKTVAALGHRRGQLAELSRPVIVDLGGATTDVHSVMSGAAATRGYASTGLPEQDVTRTVEGDLGLRENAETLLQAAVEAGHVDGREQRMLARGARLRSRAREFAADTDEEIWIDERLAALGVALALHRHAGVLRTQLSSDGAVLRRTGRDLSAATCLIVTGGIFEHTAGAGAIAMEALRLARARESLVPGEVPVFRDRAYLLWAAGLLSSALPLAASRIAETTLVREEAR